MVDEKGLEAAAEAVANEIYRTRQRTEIVAYSEMATNIVTAYLSSVQAEPVAQIDDKMVEAAREIYRLKVAEYDRDFRDPRMSGEQWEAKYGTNLHSTSLGEKWAMAQALAAAPAEREPVAVAVKPLEWQERACGDEWFANTVVGTYEVGLINASYIATRRFIEDSQWEDDVFASGLGSAGDAKAAAEADYASRIRSALVATPPAERVVEAQRHPLEAYADSYAQMARMGDGTVDCRSVEVDIRQNMIPVTTALAAKPAVKGDETVVETLRALVKMRKGVVSDVNSAHLHRGNGASDWMRENDRDFRLELDAAFDAAEAALAAKDGRS